MTKNTKTPEPPAQESVQSIVRRTMAGHSFYRSTDAARWKVERAGSATGGYGRGWFATQTSSGTGQWFPTWREALDWANAQVASSAVGAA